MQNIFGPSQGGLKPLLLSLDKNQTETAFFLNGFPSQKIWIYLKLLKEAKSYLNTSKKVSAFVFQFVLWPQQCFMEGPDKKRCFYFAVCWLHNVISWHDICFTTRPHSFVKACCITILDYTWQSKVHSKMYYSVFTLSLDCRAYRLKWQTVQYCVYTVCRL